MTMKKSCKQRNARMKCEWKETWEQLHSFLSKAKRKQQNYYCRIVLLPQSSSSWLIATPNTTNKWLDVNSYVYFAKILFLCNIFEKCHNTSDNLNINNNRTHINHTTPNILLCKLSERTSNLKWKRHETTISDRIKFNLNNAIIELNQSARLRIKY